MIQSMTGFGRGEAKNENYEIAIEMKSVNHRYLDIGLRLPRKLSAYETLLRKQVKDYADRGKVDLSVSFEDLSEKSAGITYNRETAEAYLAGVRRLSRDLKLEDNTDAYMIATLPEVFTLEEPEIEPETMEQLLNEAMREAGARFVESRRTEGEKLRDDLLSKLARVRELVDQIAARAPEILAEYRQKITDKVTELLQDVKLDEGVLATELVVYADKVCVDEEMVRLKTHISHMEETLQDGGAIGRKLDFITQEMNREANTILSKANDIEISNCGIELKTEIEKIREQIQNIE